MDKKPVKDVSTEDKIKNAARLLFHQKGYAATRTRDIAEEAGINLALLNYYFRSKKKLFNIIMEESLHGLVNSITEVINNSHTTLNEKVEAFVSNYIRLLVKEPDLPIFVLSVLKTDPDEFISKTGIARKLMNSVFMQQVKEKIESGEISASNPLHFLINILGMTIFPFIASPLLKRIGDFNDEEFNNLMLEREKLIPLWIESMTKAK